MLVEVSFQALVYFFEIRCDEHHNETFDFGSDSARQKPGHAGNVFEADYQFAGEQYTGAVGAVCDEGVSPRALNLVWKCGEVDAPVDVLICVVPLGKVIPLHHFGLDDALRHFWQFTIGHPYIVNLGTVLSFFTRLHDDFFDVSCVRRHFW